MEFKRCARCGCFFMSSNDVCCNCESKDKIDIAKLSSFLEENNNCFNYVESLSIASGINLNNLNRFIKDNQIPNLNINL